MPKGHDPLAPEAFFTTDLSVLPVRIIEWFVFRWSIEVTFAEIRRHLGVETTRQWAAKAIARTTPALVLGFRQFLTRGLDNVQGEWTLVCLAWNLKRMTVLRLY